MRSPWAKPQETRFRFSAVLFVAYCVSIGTEEFSVQGILEGTVFFYGFVMESLPALIVFDLFQTKITKRPIFIA